MKPTPAGEPRFYRSLIANNQSVPVNNQSTSTWLLLTWDDGGSTSYVPPMDLRVVNEEYQEYGLTRNTILSTMGMPNLTKEFVFDSLLGLGTLKMMLMNGSFSVDLDNHQFISDVNANEFPAGGDYSAGGVTLTNVTTVIDNNNDQMTLDFDDPGTLDNLTGTLGGVVIYVDTGTPGTSRIVDEYKVTNRTLSNESQPISLDPSGLFKI